MTRRTYSRIAFALAVIAGVTLLACGMFVPELYAAGGVILAASLGFFQGAFSKERPSPPPEEEERQQEAEVLQNETVGAPTPRNTPERTNHMTYHWHATQDTTRTTASGTTLNTHQSTDVVRDAAQDFVLDAHKNTLTLS